MSGTMTGRRPLPALEEPAPPVDWDYHPFNTAPRPQIDLPYHPFNMANVPLFIRPERRFRPEVEGLRALAVLMVISYHIWFGRVSGGVDVFLLISAFLLTGSFIRKVESGQPLRLLHHWLHLFKRLIPAAAVVLLAVFAATILWLPQTRWKEIFREGWASLAYVENWALAASSVDYGAADHSSASPLQHFWSQSIQGQVFILWPVIFAVCALIAKSTGARYRVVLTYAFGAVFATSLAFSIYETGTNQALAYFDTRARLWEFALGSLLAIVLPLLDYSRGIRVVMGWIGVAAMISCGIVLQVQQQFPGYAALWPTLAACLIIVAGDTRSRFGVDRILASKPMTFLGGNSYALYLWHWPLLVIYLSVAGREAAGLRSGAAIIAVSLILAVLTTRFVERPVRNWEWASKGLWRPALVLAVGAALVATPLVDLQRDISKPVTQALIAPSSVNPGAAALFPGYVMAEGTDRAPLVPGLAQLADEWPVWAGGCAATGPADLFRQRCENTWTGTPAKTVALIGSSHAFMWSGPFLEMAKSRNWRVVSYTGGWCPLTAGADKTIPAGCKEYIDDSITRTLALKPDLFVTNSTRAGYSGTGTEYLDPDWTALVSRFTDAGIPVLGIRDTPRFDVAPVKSGPDCVAKHLKDYSTCVVAQNLNYADVPVTEAIRDTTPGVTFLDFTHYFCQDGVCPAVIGNVVAYKDSNHVTATFLKTLTPAVADAVFNATGWDREEG
ncbi:MAG TPA: acyltransferase family protein [Arthrobacter sp.]